LLRFKEKGGKENHITYAADSKKLLESIPPNDLAGLRDRALMSTMHCRLQ
jgi:hypothetical protein